MLKLPCHAFPVITRPLVCYEGEVHSVASKTLTQKIPPQNASLEIRHCPIDSSGYRMMSCGTRNKMDQSGRAMATPSGAGRTLCQPNIFQNIAQFKAGYAQHLKLKDDAIPSLFGPFGAGEDSGTQPVSLHCYLCIYQTRYLPAQAKCQMYLINVQVF